MRNNIQPNYRKYGRNDSNKISKNGKLKNNKDLICKKINKKKM